MKKLYFILSLLLLLSSCEPLDCPMDESRYPYKGQGSFTAEKLVGIWQCYYPMTIEGIEFKEIYFYRNGMADIIMAIPGSIDRYTCTYKYSYRGNTLKFSRDGSTYSFTVTGYLFPELYFRDSYGRYTMAYRSPLK